jgi:hypothetical protein
MIGLEFYIRGKMGLDVELQEKGKEVHRDWRYRGQGFKGKLNAQRLTGIWTTAFANALM